MSGSGVFFDKKECNSQSFTVNGTFNVPDGVHQVFVEMYGGGGAGGREDSFGLTSEFDVFGGEAGQFVFAPIFVTPGSSISVTIGSGGSGVDSSLNANTGRGNDGGDTLFGTKKAAGGFGGGNSVYMKGHGIGRNSFRANGGSLVDVSGSGTEVRWGGDAGYGNGGDAPTGTANGGNGGIGAGGGSCGSSATPGSGGNGICIVYWKQP